MLRNIGIQNGDLKIYGNRGNCNVNPERLPDPTRGSLNEGVIKRDFICGKIQSLFYNRLRSFH